MRAKLLSLIIVAFLAIAISAPAAAFLKFDGVDGESTHPNHPGAIEILSWNWGGEKGDPGLTRQRGAGKVSLQDFHFVMAVSKATPKLMLACAAGTHIPEATLTLRKAGSGEESTVYLKITMSDVLVSSFQTGGSSDSTLPSTEQVSLNFTKIKFDYTVQATGEIVSGEYDSTLIPQ